MENTIAERLLQLREKNHMTQANVAKLLGVTPALISAYEKSERKPSIEKLASLADIYHTSTDYILGRTSKNDQTLWIDTDRLTDRQIEILRELIANMNTQI